MKIKKKNKYELGSYVKAGEAVGVGANMIGGITGNPTLSSVGSGIMAGSSFGPPGMLIGGGLGLLTGLLGANNQRKAEKAAIVNKKNAASKEYSNDLDSNLDIINENPYGIQQFENGGEVVPNIINIEKGELQIDPNNRGKIIREYKGINPETGGLYEEHSKKGSDTPNNMVSAKEGTFIITKKEAKNYKDTINNNDKIARNTILQNIRNLKEKVNNTNTFALGADVPFKNPTGAQGFNSLMNMWGNGLTPGMLAPSVGGVSLNPGSQLNTNLNLSMPSVAGVGGNQGPNLTEVGKFLSQYGPSLANMGKGAFGKTEVQNYVTPNSNPYKSQILSNMPQDISFEPVRNEMYRQANVANAQINNTTAGSPIARANKQNVLANTQVALGKSLMDNQIANNSVRGQRQSIYNNLGVQDMNEASRVQQINLGIDDINARNRAAKSNLFNTGLGQFQETYMNNNKNNTKANMDKYKIELLKQMFPNLKYYGDSFDYNKILGGK